MSTFSFDESKGFDANLEAFLDHMSAEDAEMGAILRAHAARLKGAVGDARRRSARADFNQAVKESLDQLMASEAEGQ